MVCNSVYLSTSWDYAYIYIQGFLSLLQLNLLYVLQDVILMELGTNEAFEHVSGSVQLGKNSAAFSRDWQIFSTMNDPHGSLTILKQNPEMSFLST